MLDASGTVPARRIVEPLSLRGSSRGIWRFGAGDRIRTGDILLGKQTLCQLSYSRSEQGQLYQIA